jgi:hypothetical protein
MGGTNEAIQRALLSRLESNQYTFESPRSRSLVTIRHGSREFLTGRALVAHGCGQLVTAILDD